LALSGYGKGTDELDTSGISGRVEGDYITIRGEEKMTDKKKIKRLLDWAYRVVKHTREIVDDKSYSYFDICEVYRDDDGKLSWTVKSKPPVGGTPDELKADLEMMLKALDRSVLEEKQGGLADKEIWS
jgi:hypothetical protein